MRTNFFYAKHKLRLFNIRLKAYMLRLEKTKSINFGTPQDSELGKWLADFNKNHMVKSILSEQVIRNHELLYEIAQNVVDFTDREDFENAGNEYQKFIEAYHRFHETLENLENDFKQPA